MRNTKYNFFLIKITIHIIIFKILSKNSKYQYSLDIRAKAHRISRYYIFVLESNSR